MKKTDEELGEDLCGYCPLPAHKQGVTNYGDGPIYCADSVYCEKAYQAYLDEEDDDEEED